MPDIVFDLETKESFDDVGGRGNIERLTVSVLGAYRYDTDEFLMYEESELNDFGALLKEDSIRLVGFNISGFDIPVLKKYVGTLITRLPILDIMDEVTSVIGRRLPLSALLGGTLGEEKTGHGLEAIALWRAGKVQEVKDYCEADVRLTRDLYNYGREHGEVYFTSQMDGSRYRVPVSWGGGGAQQFDAVIDQAHTARLCLSVIYDTEEGEQHGTLELHRVDDTSVEGRLRETGKTVRIEKSSLKNVRLIVQHF